MGLSKNPNFTITVKGGGTVYENLQSIPRRSFPSPTVRALPRARSSQKSIDYTATLQSHPVQ